MRFPALGRALRLVGRADQQLRDRQVRAGEEGAQGPRKTQGQEGRAIELSTDATHWQRGGGFSGYGVQNVQADCGRQTVGELPRAIAGQPSRADEFYGQQRRGHAGEHRGADIDLPVEAEDAVGGDRAERERGRQFADDDEKFRPWSRTCRAPVCCQRDAGVTSSLLSLLSCH